MRKTLSLTVLALAVAFTSCGGNKQMVGDDFIPCMEESYDKEGEYLAGFGSSYSYSQSDALLSANKKAVIDVMSKFLNELTPEQEAYINKNAVVVCRKFVLSNNGEYGCFVTVHVKDNEILHCRDSKQTVVDTERSKVK